MYTLKTNGKIVGELYCTEKIAYFLIEETRYILERWGRFYSKKKCELKLLDTGLLIATVEFPHRSNPPDTATFNFADGTYLLAEYRSESHLFQPSTWSSGSVFMQGNSTGSWFLSFNKYGGEAATDDRVDYLKIACGIFLVDEMERRRLENL